jgi:hypothetical protein
MPTRDGTGSAGLRYGIVRWLVVAWLGSAMANPAESLAAFAEPFSSWAPGPGAVGDGTSYAGYIETPTANATVPNGSFLITGWFVDTTAQGWAGADDIQIYAGKMDQGGTMLAEAAFAHNRPDVAAALANPYYASSGYSAIIDGSHLQLGPQTLTVYTHTPGNGWWYEEVPVQVGSLSAGAGIAGGATATDAGAGSCSGSAANVTIENATQYAFTISANGPTSRTITVGSGQSVSMMLPVFGEPPHGIYSISMYASVAPKSDETMTVAPLSDSWDLGNCDYSFEIVFGSPP